MLAPLRKSAINFYCRWLKENKNINVLVEPWVSKELLTQDTDHNLVQTWDNGKKIYSI
jgi:NAD+ kinase